MNYTGTHNVTGKGQGIYNTVAGSLGLASFLGMGNNNGCGNGLFNLGGNNDCYETKEAAALRTALAIAESEKVTAQTSKTDMEKLFQELRTQDSKIADGVIQTGNAVGILNSQVACLQQEVTRNREEARFYTDTKVEAEANLRKCEDEKILVYTNGQLAQKVDYSKRIDSSLLCGTDCCNY